MKSAIGLAMMVSVLLWTPVFAEEQTEHKEAKTVPAASSTSSTAVQTTATPLGLKKQGKKPRGLKKKGKTPPGWSHGKKTGWENHPSHVSHPGAVAQPGVGHGHR